MLPSILSLIKHYHSYGLEDSVEYNLLLLMIYQKQSCLYYYYVISDLQKNRHMLHNMFTVYYIYFYPFP